jgi:outer membrane protein OmpA-like peptidoglycan-associated protein
MDGKKVSKGKTNPAQNGYYFVTGLKPGEKYTIKFEDPAYFKQEFQIDIPATNKYAEFSRDFLIKPKYKGLEIPAKVPPFEVNKSKLRLGSDFFLDDIVSTLKNNPTMKVDVVCYPDNDNNDQLNSKLTEGRTNSLKEFLVKNGIDASRLTFAPKSKTDPKNPPPAEKRAKGKRYVGSIYFVVSEV